MIDDAGLTDDAGGGTENEGRGRGGGAGGQDDDWDRDSWDHDSWDRDDWDRDDWDDDWDRDAAARRDGREVPGRKGESADAADEAAAEAGADSLSQGKRPGYTAPGPDSAVRRPAASSTRRLDRGHQVAYMLLAGIGLGAGIGYGIDRLIGSFPALMLVGVFVGFVVALYAVFIETR